jgi:hypothetical protein
VLLHARFWHARLLVRLAAGYTPGAIAAEEGVAEKDVEDVARLAEAALAHSGKVARFAAELNWPHLASLLAGIHLQLGASWRTRPELAYLRGLPHMTFARAVALADRAGVTSLAQLADGHADVDALERALRDTEPSPVQLQQQQQQQQQADGAPDTAGVSAPPTALQEADLVTRFRAAACALLAQTQQRALQRVRAPGARQGQVLQDVTAALLANMSAADEGEVGDSLRRAKRRRVDAGAAAAA